MVDDIGCGDLVKDRQVSAVDPILVEAANDGAIFLGRRSRTIGSGCGACAAVFGTDGPALPRSMASAMSKIATRLSWRCMNSDPPSSACLTRGPSLFHVRHSGPPELALQRVGGHVHEQRRAVRADSRGGGLAQPLDQCPHRGPVEDAAAAHRGAAGEPHQKPLLPGLTVAGAIGFIGDDRQRLGQQRRVGEIGQIQRLVASRQDPG